MLYAHKNKLNYSKSRIEDTGLISVSDVTKHHQMNNGLVAEIETLKSKKARTRTVLYLKMAQV